MRQKHMTTSRPQWTSKWRTSLSPTLEKAPGFQVDLAHQVVQTSPVMTPPMRIRKTG